MTESIKILSQLPDEKFMKKLGLISDKAEVHTDRIVFELFEHFKHSDATELEEYLIKEKMTRDRTNLILKFFQKWRSKVATTKSLNISDREELIDIHWKLAVKAGDSAQDSQSMYIQTMLIVEANGVRKRHHLRMGIDTFYDFLHKLGTTNSNIQEILNT